MTSGNLWAIEYSHSEGTFHIGRTTEMIRRNLYSLDSGEKSDYICVGIFPSREQAEHALMDFKRKRLAYRTLALL
ncbi:MAG: hypothetical protein D6748_12555 [Calditrichaeota bacterium]|nr:MAG: hypothetical protein D6748_12555 [Calditrichota bacterium]